MSGRRGELTIFEEIVEKARSRLLNHLAEIEERAKCESPIEEIMLAAVYSFFRFHIQVPFVFMGPGEREYISRENEVRGLLRMYSQFPVGEYRVDFMLIMQLGKQLVEIAIECDGHEFHERTKEQAVHDRAKDRDLQAKGITILRFTGSEIWADPTGCALEVYRVVSKKLFDADL